MSEYIRKNETIIEIWEEISHIQKTPKPTKPQQNYGNLISRICLNILSLWKKIL